MASHGKKEIDLSKGYEKNEIQLRGIIMTTVCLFLTCVVSFFLMWVLQNEMEKSWVSADKENAKPMGLKPEDKLPPEPRLQVGPGFGIDGPNGRVNLELKAPQSEWRELQEIWAKQETDGQKVIENGKETAVTLPIEEAKKKLLAEGVKSVSAQDGEKNMTETNGFYSSASAGRVASEKRQ